MAVPTDSRSLLRLAHSPSLGHFALVLDRWAFGYEVPFASANWYIDGYLDVVCIPIAETNANTIDISLEAPNYYAKLVSDDFELLALPHNRGDEVVENLLYFRSLGCVIMVLEVVKTRI